MVVSHVSSYWATWLCLVILLYIHLAMNRAAVRAVTMTTLNRHRANIVLSNFMESGKVLTPYEVSQQHERIFEWDGVLRWKGSPCLAKARIGSLQGILTSLAPPHKLTGSSKDADFLLVRLVELFDQEEYLLWYSFRLRFVSIVLKDKVQATSQLKAWAHGLLLVHRIHDGDNATADTDESVLKLVEATLKDISRWWGICVEQLNACGWNTATAVLETAPTTRIRLETKLQQNHASSF